MKKLALCCLLAASVSQNFAIAANQPTKEESVNYSLNNYAQTGVILGAQAGYSFWGNSTIKDELKEENGQTGGYMGGLLIGYDFALTDYSSLGVESGFQYNHNIGRLDDRYWDPRDHFIYSVYSIPMMVTGKFFVPYAYGLHVIGKAGYALDHIIYGCAHYKEINNSFKPVVAAGVGFKFDDVAVSLQWQHNWMTFRLKENNYSHIALGLTYTLPF